MYIPGMDRMHKAMTVYVKSLSKRAEGDDREKTLPGGHLGSSMVTHGEDFEPDSEFGNCLSCACHPTSTVSNAHETDFTQPSVEQTSAWLVYRRRTSRALLPHG